jgi:hypothetical protein
VEGQHKVGTVGTVMGGLSMWSVPVRFARMRKRMFRIHSRPLIRFLGNVSRIVRCVSLVVYHGAGRSCDESCGDLARSMKESWALFQNKVFLRARQPQYPFDWCDGLQT